jgi:hypothetical protein
MASRREMKFSSIRGSESLTELLRVPLFPSIRAGDRILTAITLIKNKFETGESEFKGEL